MAVLLQYNAAVSLAPSTTATGVTGSTLTNESLNSFTVGSAGGYATEPVVLAGPASGATSVAAAVTASSNFFLSITPQSGKKISLTTLTFNIARGGSAVPRGYAVRSSLDGYTANLATADVSTQRFTFTAVSVDLSGSGFQNLTSSVTFKVYLYAPSVGNLLDIDDLIVNGTVADSGTIDQEGFRFRNDNGTETTATWLAAQDTNITQPKSTNTRLRVLLNTTLDRSSEDYQLEYREVGGTEWSVIS